MTDLDGVVLHVHGPATAADQLDTVADLYAVAFFPPPHNQGPTELARMVEAWPRRLTAPGFRLVVAEHGGQAIGCIYGHQLLPGTKWWEGALEPLPENLTSERDGRTLAIIDMMVRDPWRRRGLAQALHGHLLVGRTEERVTLLVDPINEPARRAYRKWGYELVGRLQPFPDSPKFEAMIKVLDPDSQ
jgi:GNAT superfamily N-acetyltransferase